MPVRGQSSRATARSPLPTAARTAALRRALANWFRRAKRDLPWRRTRDPYAVWLSEVMLQQTQVATVVDYFHRFTAAFPTIADLAAAPEPAVLRQWEGLGYYRRARQLHRAAALIVGEHGGEFPRDPDAVRALPGIGRYTAGAILSIAFDRPEPILEANTIRVLSRLAAFRGDPHDRAGQDYLWSWAAALVPAKEPGLFNQALMELGALVCTPRSPRCGECPVAALCPTRRLGLQDEIPRAKAKPVFEDVHEGVLLVTHRDGRRVLVVERAAGGRWAGMWDFPRFTLTATRKPAAIAELQRHAQEALGLKLAVGELAGSLKYGVTRFHITLDAYRARAMGGRLKPQGFAAARWVRPADLAEYPLNVSARKLVKFTTS
jgi:A/G-specific adenine glycosylase